MMKQCEWPLVFGWALVFAFHILVHVAHGLMSVESTVSPADWLIKDRLATMPLMTLFGELCAQQVCLLPKSQSDFLEMMASVQMAFLLFRGKTEKLSCGMSQW